MGRYLPAYTKSNGTVVHPWEPEDEQWLREHGHEHTIRELAAKFPTRARQNIRYKMLHMGLHPKPGLVLRRDGMQWNRYSEEDDLLIGIFAGIVSAPELADFLGRTETALWKHAEHRGVSLAVTHREWSEREKIRLISLCENNSIGQVAEQMGRTYQSVQHKMRDLNLKPFGGVYSLSEAIRHTGYAHTQLYAARDTLGQHWKKISWRLGRYLISDNQLQACCDWLRDELNGRLRVRPLDKSVAA
jgi:hypothetical protein